MFLCDVLLRLVLYELSERGEILEIREALAWRVVLIDRDRNG